MFKSAFLSEYTLHSDDDLEEVLKSHLLSNGEIVVPAAAMRHQRVASLVHSNMGTLAQGAMKIAHGNDCEGLLGYMQKYPETSWSASAVEAMGEFEAKSQVAIYDISNTFERFNAVMRRNARGGASASSHLFGNRIFRSAVLSGANRNLFEFFDLAKLHAEDAAQLGQMNSFLKYLYNLCGALSTNSGNTFSLENSRAFNYVSSGMNNESAELNSGLALLVSSALDVTDGIEDFSFLQDLSQNDLSHLSFVEVLEIRNSWLHEALIEKYERVVQNCVEAITAGNRGDVEGALIHIDRAFELRSEISNQINSRIQSEINAYKVHRLSRFLADSAIQLVSFFSGVSLVQSIAQTIYGATTEVAVLTNRETELRKLVQEKTRKAKEAKATAELLLRSKSPTLEYLRKIDEALSKQTS